MPLAMDINFQKVGRTWGLRLAKNPWKPDEGKITKSKILLPIKPNAYAYAFEWQAFLCRQSYSTNSYCLEGVKARGCH